MTKKLGAVSTIDLTVRGREFTIKENLTIGEEIAFKSRRSNLCMGRFGDMMISPVGSERDTATLAHAVAEIDARVTKGDKEWTIASEEKDEEFVTELWKEIVRLTGTPFPDDSDAEEEPGNDDEEDSEEKS